MEGGSLLKIWVEYIGILRRNKRERGCATACTLYSTHKGARNATPEDTLAQQQRRRVSPRVVPRVFLSLPPCLLPRVLCVPPFWH